jgi:hypothetical protein
LRSARLQGLLEVGPARLLAAMLKRSGCLYTMFDQDHDLVFFSFFDHQTSHAICFNARGLLYECVFDAFLFSSSYRPDWEIRFLITSLLDLLFLLFWIIIPVILPAMMLGYYSMSASSMPSEFFIVVSIYWKSASYRPSLDLSTIGKTTNRSTTKLTCSFFF